MSDFLNYDWGAALSSLGEIIREPGTNPRVAFMLLAIITLIILVLMVAAILVVLSNTSADEEEDDDVGVERAQVPTEGEVVGSKLPAPRRKGSWLVLTAVWVVGLFLVVLSAGWATSTDSTCLGCHAQNPHTEALADPHENTACVACHESGTTTGRLFTDVPSRVTHIALGVGKNAKGVSPTVSSRGCVRCHESQIEGTITIKQRAVKVSHGEPLSAGAECIDCHVLTGGAVSDRVVGMAPCMRCHDGKTASTECGSCHTGDPALAVRTDGDSGVSAVLEGTGGRRLVSQPKCDGCHKNQSRCDSCHGIKMPHTDEFKAGGHARAAAIDIWKNQGKGCGKCHYANHNDCRRCHEAFRAHGANWAQEHSAGGDYNASCACHARLRRDPSTSFCSVCHDVRSRQ